ncbi:MAG: 50S ribosomal protein L1 [Candidatus Firestonebacteria bacterium]
MSKRYNAIVKIVDRSKQYNIEEAVLLLKKTSTAKFDESVDIAIKVGIDLKKPEQQVRGTVSLPNGTGKAVRILVFAKGEKEKEARDAGADFIGAEDLMEKINGGWTDFDVTIATPDIMKEVGKLGKVLGPKGLMPNPKTGTVTFELAKAIKEIKAGRVEYKVDAGGVISVSLGKVSFSEQQIVDNIMTLMDVVVKSKPVGMKGEYLRAITISSSMGIGIKLDCHQFLKAEE